MRLFRSETTSRHRDRLSGYVAVAVPISWQLIGFLLFAGILSFATFLSLASYVRVENAIGHIAPEKGVVLIVPKRTGVVTSIAVKDGNRVPAGAELAVISAEEDGTGDKSSAEIVQSYIVKQDANLFAQSKAMMLSALAQVAQISAHRNGLQAEITQLLSQIRTQQSLVISAKTDLDRARKVADRGFVSGRDLLQREETLLSRQQGLAQLQQAVAAKHAALAEDSQNEKQISAQARAQAASLAATRAEVAQQAANVMGARSYALRAPVAGEVTALTGRIGQAVNAQTQLMTIVPAGTTLRAELSVPSAAIGFVKPGQDVRLAIDAFPYQRFGTVTGTVLTVAASAVSVQGPNGSTVSFYPVTVGLKQTTVHAYGRTEPLISGMTLTARIVTEKQSLLQWLFEPLFAVRNR